MTTTKLELVKQILWDIDPSLKGAEEDKSYQTAVVLLSALSKFLAGRPRSGGSPSPAMG